MYGALLTEKAITETYRTENRNILYMFLKQSKISKCKIRLEHASLETQMSLNGISKYAEMGVNLEIVT